MTWRALAVAALLLGGCAALQPGAQDVLAVDSIVGEALLSARGTAAEQKAALGQAQQAFAIRPSPLNRLRLAILLATLPPPLREDARAAELLAPIASPRVPGVGRLAAMLAGQLAERRRLARELERLAQEAERVARERERLDRERELEAKERDKREEALRQQLEALRSIERSILEREEKLRRRQR